MRHALKAPRLLGLLALLAGLMAFSATAAQAELNAKWLVNGTAISGSLLPTINAEKDTKHLIFLTKTGLGGSTTLEILCTEIASKGGLLHELGKATGKIHFSNCETFLNGALATKCKPHSAGAAEGLIESEALEGLIKLHKLTADGVVHGVVEVLPVNAGMVFVAIKLGKEVGSECSLAGASLTGTGFLWDCLENGKGGSKDAIKHLFEEFKPLTKLLYGGNPATIDGSFWAFLTGAHVNQTWAGHAG